MGNRNNLAMLAVLYGSAFVAAFNENTINVALISIMGEFAVDANTAQWLVTGYMIVTAIVVTVSAFLTKRLRLRTLFLTAAGFLTLGLVAAMLAPTWPLFLAARLVQAVGTGIFIPVMMSTVLAVAPRTRMGTYLSIDGCMITFGPAFAPVVSGLMVTTLGWRSIFLPPAALIVVLAFLGVALIRNIAEPEKIKLDGISVVLSAVGLTSFVFGLSLVMASPMVAVITIAVGLAVMGAFVVRQHRIPNPLLNLTPMHNRLFAPVCVLVVVAMMTTFSMSVLLPLYFEGALGTTAL
ncbi:MAG: MFS transporter, partial [Adlercreutzia equolifaciens]